jgi:uncharacterized protein
LSKQKQYRPRDWIHPVLHPGPSRIHGTGTFAKALIREDEVVWIFGGAVFSKEEIDAGRSNKPTLMQIDEEHWLGSRADESLSDDYFLNHSCDPNTWMQDEVTLVARRDIQSGGEVTMDYAMHFADPNWAMKNPCSCDSKLCRRTITGKDWMLKDLQIRYGNHFSPLINKRIAKLVGELAG